MARTKRVTAAKPTEAKIIKSEAKEALLKKKDEKVQREMPLLDQRMEADLEHIELKSLAFKATFPKSMLNRTIEDIINGEIDLTNTFNSTKDATNKSIKNVRGNNTTSTSSCNSSVLNATRVISSKRLPRSVSAGVEDEGYRTAESTSGTASGGNQQKRKSRSNTRTHLKPTARSLSRTQSTRKTPLNRPPVAASGTITPKCKPGTPVMVIRRPKIGEVAWSNTGSPLLVTGTVVPEDTANVNIPIGGNIVSVLPRRVVRESQIPDMDAPTRKQLEILRDNLIKICKKK